MKSLAFVFFTIVSYTFGAKHRDLRQLQEQKVVALKGFDLLEGFGGMACTECFDKIDESRDCLRQCNQVAYPGDSCCCCCKCDKDGLGFPGSDGKCEQDLDFDQCDATYGNNCKWELDKSDKNNHNKWYNLDKFCDCDKKDDWDGDHNNDKKNCKEDDRRHDDDRSLLDFCLSGENDFSVDTVESIDDLVECCDFEDKKCDEYFEEVKECLIGCINPCMITRAAEWLDCMRDSGEEKKCSRQECLDGYLQDLPEELDLDKDPDIFDLKTVYKLVEKIHMEDLENCHLLDEFVQETCDIGNDCCDRCQQELGQTVDCLVNGIVIPFAEGQLNATIDDCFIDTDKCKAEFGRKLVETEPSLESQQLAEQCQRKMEANIVAYNISYATNQFMECLITEGFMSLPDKPQGSGAGISSTMLAALLPAASFLLVPT
jgi:hypothetical protein